MEDGWALKTEAHIVLDSISEYGDRLTTVEVTHHRFVLAEENTHRKFSRNSASSRAIPVEAQLRRFIEDPWFPISMPAEQPGMQGGKELEGVQLSRAKLLLERIHASTAGLIQDYLNEDEDTSHRLHKSVLNRPMEWAQSHKVVLSSTEWQNFFDQRLSTDAQPEMRVAAEAIYRAIEGSTPTALKHGEWHKPYLLPEERISANVPLALQLMKSVARCARTSTGNQQSIRDNEEDMRFFGRLVRQQHWSPLEHVATPVNRSYGAPGNFDGWLQLRHFSTPRDICMSFVPKD